MNRWIQEIKRAKTQHDQIKKELATLPAGYLAHRGKYYSHIYQRKEIGIAIDSDLLSQLCRKRFLIEWERQLRNNLEKRNQWDERTPNEIIRSLPKTYQQIPVEHFFHPAVKCFFKSPPLKNPYPPSSWNYVSKKGIAFRSKSELMIADILETYEIPYQYDVAIELGRVTKYPDFTLLNPFTGKVFIWEHFGALNQEGYQQGMIEKMGLYLKHGFRPYENLIYTFEADIATPGRVQELVEKVVLAQ